MLTTWWSWAFMVKRLIWANLNSRPQWDLQAAFAELHKNIPSYSFPCCGLGIIHLRPSAHCAREAVGGSPHVSLPTRTNSWLYRGWGQSGKHSCFPVQEDLQPTTVALKKVKVARRTQQEKFIWIHKFPGRCGSWGLERMVSADLLTSRGLGWLEDWMHSKLP